jgi:hypothetical protein
MEGVVDFPLSRELHMVCYQANDFCDFERAKVLGPEFHGGVCHFQICSFDPYLLSLLIGVECHSLIPECLCLGHGLMCVFLCLFHLPLPFLYGWYIPFSCRLVGPR